MDYNSLFRFCVHLLQVWAKMTNMTYEEINIWIFVIIEPILFFLMCIVIIYQFSKIKTLNKIYATFSRQEGSLNDPGTDSK